MRRVLAAALLALAGPASAQIFSETNAAWAPGMPPYFGAIDPSFLGAGSTQAMWLPLSSTGAVLAEDAGTVSHLTWDGVALRESVAGVSWSMNGTVPQVAANAGPFTSKAGAGPYTSANSYQNAGNTVGEWAGDWSVTVVFNTSAIGVYQYLATKNNSTPNQGWNCLVTNGGIAVTTVYDGAAKAASAPIMITPGGINVVTCGRSGGNIYVRVNGGNSATTAGVGAMTAASAEPMRIGRYAGTFAYADSTTIYEVIASTDAYSDAVHLDRWRRAVGAYQNGTSLAVTRVASTVVVNSLTWNVAADTVRIGGGTGTTAGIYDTAVSFTSPALPLATWCVSGTWKADAVAWNAADATLWGVGTAAGANSARLRSLATGALSCEVYDVTPTQRAATWTHGYALGSSHAIKCCNNNGTMTLWSDAVPVATSATGGTGVWTSAPTTGTLGYPSTAGWVTNLKECRSGRGTDCR